VAVLNDDHVPTNQGSSNSTFDDILNRWEDDPARTPEELCADRPDLFDRVRDAIAALRVFNGSPAGNLVPSPPEDSLPASAGPFIILNEVGRGGMGVVARAYDKSVGRHVAVKLIRHRDAFARPAARARFLREARITGRLEHPGIVAVHEIGKLYDGEPYFVMKLVEGRTLGAILRERRTGPPDDLPTLLRIFRQVCDAVGYAHKKGIIHRDLKPENIMVGAFEEVQVMDWGLAKVLDGTDPDPAHEPSAPLSIPSPGAIGETRIGDVIGTPNYMSPEQARGALTLIDGRTDVFALGAILCEILTGYPLYSTDPVPHFLDVYPLALAGDCSAALARLDASPADPELKALARDCLAVNPEHRPADAEQLAENVRAYLDGLEKRVRRAELDRATAMAKAVEERRRRRWQLGLVVVLGSGVMAAVAAVAYVQEESRTIKRRVRDNLNQVESYLRQGQVDAAQAEYTKAVGLVGDTFPTQIQGQATNLQRLLELSRRLRDYRTASATGARIVAPEGTFDFQFEWNYPDLRTEFHSLGIDVLGNDPATAAEVITRSPVRLQLIAVLHQWASSGVDDTTERKLVDVLTIADPDGARVVAARRADTVELLRILRTAAGQPSPESLVAASRFLTLSGGDPEAFLAEAFARYPDDFWVRFDYAKALCLNEKFTEALVHLGAADGIKPDTALVAFRTGFVYEQMQKGPEAITYYKKAVEINPEFDWAYRGLERVSRTAGLMPGTLSERNKLHRELIDYCREKLESLPERKKVQDIFDKLPHDTELESRWVRQVEAFLDGMYTPVDQNEFMLLIQYAWAVAGRVLDMARMLEDERFSKMKDFKEGDFYQLSQLYTTASVAAEKRNDTQLARRYRKKVLENLALYFKHIHSLSRPTQVALFRTMLREPIYRPLRDPRYLDRLPSNEGQPFLAYWKGVTTAFRDAGGHATETWVR
jgi:eukaryotic-like serine/threonine-protein kinase